MTSIENGPTPLYALTKEEMARLTQGIMLDLLARPLSIDLEAQEGAHVRFHWSLRPSALDPIGRWTSDFIDRGLSDLMTGRNPWPIIAAMLAAAVWVPYTLGGVSPSSV